MCVLYGEGRLRLTEADHNPLPADPRFLPEQPGRAGLSVVTIMGDTLLIELSNDADGYVIADALRIERLIV